MNITSLYNISLSKTYLEKFIQMHKLREIEGKIKEEKLSTNKQIFLELKIEINKRLNQLTNDTNMIRIISDTLYNHRHSFIFIEQFTLRVLEQSVIQVSRYQDSFKQYALLFKILYSDQLFEYYKMCLLSKQTDENGLKGMYSVYFGILLMCDMIDEAWSFMAGLLNSDIQNTNYVVLEVYLQILGTFILSRVRQTRKLLRYIKKYVLSDISDSSQRHRITELVNNLENK